MRFLLLPVFLGFAAISAASPLHAQDSPKTFSTTAYAITGQNLTSGEGPLTLWGIDSAQPTTTQLGVQARAYLDDMIAGKPIQCVGMGAPTIVRCLTATERDLSMMMLNAGYAAVNRNQIKDSDLADPYAQAERQARQAQRGIWASASATPIPANPAAIATNGLGGFMDGLPFWFIAATFLGLPLFGFTIIAIILHLGFRQLIMLTRYQIAGTQKRERQLKEREKYVIAAALENELVTNRAKLDAFLVIYEELLKTLRDPSRTPKYQRAGDIVHEKPALVRDAFDAHVDKLDLLGPQLSAELATLYAGFTTHPDYRTLEPEVPIEKAREAVDRIVRNAEKLIEPLDKVTGALSVILRDRRSLANT